MLPPIHPFHAYRVTQAWFAPLLITLKVQQVFIDTWVAVMWPPPPPKRG